MSKLAKNRLNSTWTPLNNDDVNQKIFNERRALVIKWFEKCSEVQRLAILQELISQCNGRQLEVASAAVARRKPVLPGDFTRSFPRVLSIYLFSFLDPRSLCRCAQVSWHWKLLAEVDQLWINKCLKLGWMLSFTPSYNENGMWKRLYIENILALKSASLQTPRASAAAKPTNINATDNVTSALSRLNTSLLSSGKRPPWKGSHPAPRDTWRNNYLANEDEVEKVNRLRRRGLYGAEAENVTRRAKTKVSTGRLSARKRANSLTRPPSAMLFSTPDERPSWATKASNAPAIGDAAAAMNSSSVQFSADNSSSQHIH